MKAKPFLKWAGGKGQLIPAVEAALPGDLAGKESLVYVEPFAGSGAVLFWFLQKFSNVQHAIINDINTDLANAYRIVKEQPQPLIDILLVIQEKVTILNGDYRKTLAHVSGSAFFYIDPPYRPISKTASFNAYAPEAFGDDEQIALKEFCDGLSAKGYRWLLSNSDPKNENPQDNFFDDLYKGKSVYIKRVKAKRTINANAAKRGEIRELLISNYQS